MSGVTSLAEVWIEIKSSVTSHAADSVTSLAEVWIEISLKSTVASFNSVTSLAEVWIEIEFYAKLNTILDSHFPCGSVD